MREILFRAKAINRDPRMQYRTDYKNGDWVYGLISSDRKYHDTHFTEMTNTDGVSGIDVDRETVCEYTGLSDTNGTKIFEGDIVKITDKIVDATYYARVEFGNPTQGQPQHSKGTAYKTKEPRNDNYGKYDAIEDARKGATEKYPTSILQFVKPHPSKARHRTEKPVALLEYLIKTYTNEGDTVLDNCMGGGNTGVACVNTNRNFIGIEKQDNYFEIAEQRIQNSHSTVPHETSHEIAPLKNQINIFDTLGSNQ